MFLREELTPLVHFPLPVPCSAALFVAHTHQKRGFIKQNFLLISLGGHRYSSYLKAQFCCKGITILNNICTVIKLQSLSIWMHVLRKDKNSCTTGSAYHYRISMREPQQDQYPCCFRISQTVTVPGHYKKYQEGLAGISSAWGSLSLQLL